MEGTLHKTEQGWVVKYFDTDKSHDVMYCGESLLIHPYQNIPAFEFDGKEVYFDIEDFWETGLEEWVKVASLIETKSYLAISNPQPNSITLSLDREEPIIVIDEVGFKYKGELIEDKGEIYKLFKNYLTTSQTERMYSEEEVLNFTQIVLSQYRFGNTNIEQLDLLKETLQLFKKKII